MIIEMIQTGMEVYGHLNTIDRFVTNLLVVPRFERVLHELREVADHIFVDSEATMFVTASGEPIRPDEEYGFIEKALQGAEAPTGKDIILSQPFECPRRLHYLGRKP